MQSLAYPSGEEGGNILVQMIFTCLCYEGGRGSAPCGTNLINAEVCCKVVILVGESLDPALQVADLGQQAVDLFTLPAGLVHLQLQ
jgi:hypothetical protein